MIWTLASNQDIIASLTDLIAYILAHLMRLRQFSLVKSMQALSLSIDLLLSQFAITYAMKRCVPVLLCFGLSTGCWRMLWWCGPGFRWRSYVAPESTSWGGSQPPCRGWNCTRIAATCGWRRRSPWPLPLCRCSSGWGSWRKRPSLPEACLDDTRSGHQLNSILLTFQNQGSV